MDREQLRFAERMRRERVEVVLRAAAELIAEAGCTHIRVEDVARRAGVAKGTVYLDFPSRAELVRAAVRRSGELLVAALEERTAEVADPLAALTEAFRYLVEVPSGTAGVAVELQRSSAEPGAGGELRGILLGAIARLVERVPRDGASLPPVLVAELLLAASACDWGCLSAEGTRVVHRGVVETLVHLRA